MKMQAHYTGPLKAVRPPLSTTPYPNTCPPKAVSAKRSLWRSASPLAGLPPRAPRAPTTTRGSRLSPREARLDSGAHTRLVPRGTLTLIVIKYSVCSACECAHTGSQNQRQPKKGNTSRKIHTRYGLTSKRAREMLIVFLYKARAKSLAQPQVLTHAQRMRCLS